MKLHPRTLVVQTAECEINMAILKIAEKHGLTTVELVHVLTGVASEKTKYLLRLERHGTTDKKADEASDD